MPGAPPDAPPTRWVIGPMGERLTLEALPSPNTRRWVIRRKAEVVCAVKGGLLTREEAVRRYNISEAEFETWRHAVERHGLLGLRSTRSQHYRDREKRFM